MKLIMIKGYSKTGKTTSCTALIGELVRRGHTVGSIKDIHFEGFAIDREGSDTSRHAAAGARTVAALGLRETDVLYQRRLTPAELLRHFHEDFLVCEGDCGLACANRVTGRTTEDLERRRDERTVGFTGIVAGELHEYDGLPVISAVEAIEALADLVEERSTAI